MEIHPLAVVHPTAQLGREVAIGPFCVVEEHVVLGDRCRLHSRVAIKRNTKLGADNEVHEGAVLGGLPQHVNKPACPGHLVIGQGNTFRENVTVHCGLQEGHATRIGDANMLMVNAHVAHDCTVGSHTIIVNNVMLAGHVTVDDRAFLSGGVAVHQFCRVGRLAMVGGQAHIIKDVPPFVTIDGVSNFVVGLNRIGLRRNGFSPADVAQLKAAYRVIYRQGLSWNELLAELQTSFASGPATAFYDFLIETRRGIITERRLPPGATIKLHDQTDEAEAAGEGVETQRRAKAG